MSRRRPRRRAVVAALALFALPLTVLAPSPPVADATPAADVLPAAPRGVARDFVGLSIEWSLIERYMGPTARPAFVQLLRNLGSGVLRIGGSSQDLMPFDPAAPNTDEVITPEDLLNIRATLDEASHGHDAWRVVLGTAMSPPKDTRPFVSPEHAKSFATAVRQTFRPGQVIGIELGNEPDLSYGTSGLDRYVADLPVYAAAISPTKAITPNTSEDILPWQQIHERSVPTRWFWNWQQILDTQRPVHSSDHFYPLARTCVNKPYRCPSIPALLSAEHLASLDYQVAVHSADAAQRGLTYRLEETNTAAGRGADGVSNVAASATYAVDMMFHVACPQPPDQPGSNADCRIGGVGVNLHNAEVRAFFEPEEGNGYYNAVNYDPTPAIGAPTAQPEYYALLLFSRFVQGAQTLRPVSTGTEVQGWRADNRLVLINKTDHPITVATPRGFVDRLTPYDPTGAGRTLDAPQVRIDGQVVRADGRWPGFRPRLTHQTATTLVPGEVVVISNHP